MALSLPVVLASNFNGTNKAYAKFAASKDSCRQCLLFNTYQQVVQSEGNIEAPIFMIVGEAPGVDEVEQGRPFVGQAGQRLRQTLRKYIDVFNVTTTLISNILPCRPENNKFPQNPHLVTHCRDDWLVPEVEMVKPKILITLGGTPLRYLLGLDRITANRGQWLPVQVGNVQLWAFPTYHPSYVIRCERSKQVDVVQSFEDDFAQIANEYQSQMNQPIH